MKFKKPEELNEDDKKVTKPPEYGRTKKRLTKAEAALAVAMASNPAGSQQEWAVAAHISPKSVCKLKVSIEKKTEGDIGNALLEQGIGLEELSKVITQCLSASNHIYIKLKDNKGNEVLHLKEVPNWPVRVKTVEMLSKLGNLFPATKFAVLKSVEVIHTRKQAPIDHSVSKAKENVESIESGAIPASYEVIPDDSTIN